MDPHIAGTVKNCVITDDPVGEFNPAILIDAKPFTRAAAQRQTQADTTGMAPFAHHQILFDHAITVIYL